MLLALGVAVLGAAQDVAPDLVLTNARVYTLNWGEPARDGTPAADAPHDANGWRPDAEALVLRDGKIAYVGDAATAAARARDGATVVDLDGATVLPGLIESHTHTAELGGNLNQVSLVGVGDRGAAIARVAAHARSVPKGEWILGHGWDEGAWADDYPTMTALSRAVPDHPVLLKGLHGFAVWGNALAFERAGITAATESPSGGKILVGDDGKPSGVLLNRATPLLHAAVPAPSRRQIERNLLAGLEVLAKSGYVAVHEAGVPGSMLEALESLDAAGRLPLRFYAMLSARDAALMDDWGERGPTRGDGRLVVRSVKAYYDGALGSRGALLLADYSDRAGHRGVAGPEYGFDERRVEAMMAAGFQVAIHAIGDAGNRKALDFIEGVYSRHPEARRGRHRIEHAQVLHDRDIPRFAALDVIASMEPPHAMEDKAWAAARLGARRIRGAYAWRRLREAGARLAFNSDLPGSDHDIFYGMHSAITRRDRELSPEGGWFPDQCLTPEETVRAYTSWNAYAEFAEDHTGKLVEGFDADLTILDVDPFVAGTENPAALLEGRVVGTIVAGQFVFKKT